MAIDTLMHSTMAIKIVSSGEQPNPSLRKKSPGERILELKDSGMPEDHLDFRVIGTMEDMQRKFAAVRHQLHAKSDSIDKRTLREALAVLPETMNISAIFHGPMAEQLELQRGTAKAGIMIYPRTIQKGRAPLAEEGSLTRVTLRVGHPLTEILNLPIGFYINALADLRNIRRANAASVRTPQKMVPLSAPSGAQSAIKTSKQILPGKVSVVYGRNGKLVSPTARQPKKDTSFSSMFATPAEQLGNGERAAFQDTGTWESLQWELGQDDLSFSETSKGPSSENATSPQEFVV